MTVNLHKKIWMLAGPIIVSNVSVPLLGAVDTGVVGQLPGPEPIAAVAVGALVFSVLYAGLIFLRMGTTGLVAQSMGAADGDEVRAWFVRGALFAGILGTLIVLLQMPLMWGANAIISPSPDVKNLFESYYQIRIWGAVPALMNFVMLGWFFGVHDTKSALLTQLVMNGANIILDVWFVKSLGWGVDGVAWATVISESSAVVLGVWLVIGKARKIKGHWAIKSAFNGPVMMRMVRVNGDIFIRSMLLQSAFVVISAISARISDTVLAVNAVLLLFQTFMAYGLDAFANAVEVLSGQAVGARDQQQFHIRVKATTGWALLFSTVFTGVFWIFGTDIVRVLSVDEGVRAGAETYLIWVVISPIISVWSFQLDGVFIGATWTRQMRNTMALSLIVFLISLALLVPPFGNHGLWLALMIFMIARAVTLAVKYSKLRNAIQEPQ